MSASPAATTSAPPKAATAATTAAPTPAPAKTAPAANKAPPAPIGITSGGVPVYAPFHPSVASLAVALTPFLHSAVGLASALPLPTGLELMRAPDDSQTQLKLSPFFASKLRRCFGYVGEIKLSSDSCQVFKLC